MGTTGKRARTLKIRFTADEFAAVAARARSYGLPTGTFLRTLGCEAEVAAPAINKEAVTALLKVNADLARLGNLQKLWLDDVAKFDATTDLSIHKIIELITQTMETHRQTAKELLEQARMKR